MGRDVVVVASGETERQALPLLLRGLSAAGVSVEIRTVVHGCVTADAAGKVVVATWWERHGRGTPPDKFVVLADTDGREPEELLEALRDGIRNRVGNVGATVLCAVATWHLEAWFFADALGLRAHLGRDLGAVEGAPPDEIQSPKNCLRSLLPGPYTARAAGEIAAALEPDRVAERSPSFAAFLGAVRNGAPAA
jgi:hypothetical protein